jgi:hypothetical protein
MAQVYLYRLKASNDSRLDRIEIRMGRRWHRDMKQANLHIHIEPQISETAEKKYKNMSFVLQVTTPYNLFFSLMNPLKAECRTKAEEHSRHSDTVHYGGMHLMKQVSG